MEDLALDGSSLDGGALVPAQLIQSRGEECLDRRRHRDRSEIPDHHPAPVFAYEEPVVDEHGEHLLDEERVAFGCAGDSSPHLVGEVGFADEVRDQLRALVVGERLEEDGSRIQLASRPAGSSVEQLRPGHAEEQDRHSPRPVCEVLDEVEERLLAPVYVVEDDDKWPAGRQSFEEHANGVEAFFDARSGFGQADHASHPLGDEVGVVLTLDERGERQPRLLG